MFGEVRYDRTVTEAVVEMAKRKALDTIDVAAKAKAGAAEEGGMTTAIVTFWVCVVVGGLVGGGLLAFDDPGLKAIGLVILVGLLVAGLWLRWIYHWPYLS